MSGWYSLARVALIGQQSEECVWAGYCFQTWSQLGCQKAKGLVLVIKKIQIQDQFTLRNLEDDMTRCHSLSLGYLG